ncbi:conserved Plasmodium protein, unknown function [Plasmodium sp. gorilla clade G2]|uniref:conserved Plasmodium protein, unknown function n=1 Tax=Plasmodium sp. gorilla clade G2 TaxID=880535 RepID=UPI000D21CAD5|nr:conserved Plasmodium protein, unknown function [Plasmodium sp. gorilla clade G2]SOV16932.1 conserved Plasmodium protein, unknown function [Plasmodium sp. gorilla clade G2]
MKDICNYPIGQEVILDKLIYEKRFLKNKKKQNKIKNVNELNYYLNNKFDFFLGHMNFMKKIFKKKKKFLKDDERDKHKYRIKKEIGMNKKICGKRKNVSNECDKKKRLHKERSIENDDTKNKYNNNDVSHCSNNSSSYNKQTIDIQNVSEKNECNKIKIEGNICDIKNEQDDMDEKHSFNNSINNCNVNMYNKKNEINNVVQVKREKSIEKQLEIKYNDNINDNICDKICDKICDNISNNTCNNIYKHNNKLINNNYYYYYHCDEVSSLLSEEDKKLHSFSPLSNNSELSNVSNMSPDMLCFEKQFKYIYDIYKQNDKNVFLFYNPPVCKCVNKNLKEQYFRRLNDKYPCLFNCSYSLDSMKKIKNDFKRKSENINDKNNINNSKDEKSNNKLLNDIEDKKEVADHYNINKNCEQNIEVPMKIDINCQQENINVSHNYSEVASYAVEIKMYAKAFFELYFMQKYGRNKDVLKVKYDNNNNNINNNNDNIEDHDKHPNKNNSDNKKTHDGIHIKQSDVNNINNNIDIHKKNNNNNNNDDEKKKLCLSFFSSTEEEKALKTYFDKCLYKIIKRRSRTCDNNLCCGLLYIPYSYIVVLLNRKVENLTYACTFLRIPSDTDIYYNNKKNVITLCTKNSQHEFFCYYSLKQNNYVKNIIIYDIYYEGFIPFFRPILNLKNKKNQDKIQNFITYNKNINLSIVFFLTNTREKTEKYKSDENVEDDVYASNEEKSNIQCNKEDEKNEESNMKDNNTYGISNNSNYDDDIKKMRLKICKIFNINHRNNLNNNMSTSKRNMSHESNPEDNIEKYFSNLCSGMEVINNMNIKMVVDKIIKIINKNDSVCNEKCIYHEYNKNYMKYKDIQIYLCEEINSFSFDRRPLVIKKREVNLSSYVHFNKIINNLYEQKNCGHLLGLINQQLDNDIFIKTYMKEKILKGGVNNNMFDHSICSKEDNKDNIYSDHNNNKKISFSSSSSSNEIKLEENNQTILNSSDIPKNNDVNHNIVDDTYLNNINNFHNNNKNNSDDNILITASEDKETIKKCTDNIFNDTFFIFNENSDLYTNEEYKKNRIDTINNKNIINEYAKNKMLKYTSNNYLSNKISTNILQNLFNIYVSSYLMKKNNYNISHIEKKKKKKEFKNLSNIYKLKYMKECYYFLFNMYKNKFHIQIKEQEEKVIHKYNWMYEDFYLNSLMSQKRKKKKNVKEKEKMKEKEKII